MADVFVPLQVEADTAAPHEPITAYKRLVDQGDGTVAEVVAAPAGTATSVNQDTTNTRIGSLTEAAPGTDTASSGLNGRLQRIAQRLTSLIALLPASLGQKASAASLSVTIASDQFSGALTDRSGTITTGGTQQTLAAANSARRYLFIQNIHATEDLWFNFTTAAVVDQPSIRLRPGESYENPAGFVSTELVSVIAATTGHKFVAKEA